MFLKWMFRIQNFWAAAHGDGMFCLHRSPCITTSPLHPTSLPSTSPPASWPSATSAGLSSSSLYTSGTLHWFLASGETITILNTSEKLVHWAVFVPKYCDMYSGGFLIVKTQTENSKLEVELKFIPQTEIYDGSLYSLGILCLCTPPSTVLWSNLRGKAVTTV